MSREERAFVAVYSVLMAFAVLAFVGLLSSILGWYGIALAGLIVVAMIGVYRWLGRHA